MPIHAKNDAIVELQVNGQQRKVVCRNADTLLYVLREKLGLTGAKPGCENGDCGACTVLVNEWPMKSCLMLAVETTNHPITTIEALEGALIQKAFVEHWAFQCGYCTPGFIVNGHALTEIHPDADNKLITDWLQSNICRCTGYKEIETAIKFVLDQKRRENGSGGG